MKKTIRSVAQEMLDNMEYKKRTDGSAFYCTIKVVDWQRDIIHEAHGDKMPDDYTYEFINDALITLTEAEEGNEDDAIYQIEPDVYTSDLTAWLHSRCDRVYYIEEAIQNGATDGFQVLAIAQQVEKHEVANEVLNGIRKYIENEE